MDPGTSKSRLCVLRALRLVSYPGTAYRLTGERADSLLYCGSALACGEGPVDPTYPPSPSCPCEPLPQRKQNTELQVWQVEALALPIV